VITDTHPENKVFNYHTLRTSVGLIALSIPAVVIFFSSETLNSISAYYYTNARDLFVGMLFIVGAFLFAYNGHTDWQARWSKVAALAAFGVALFPTTKQGGAATFTSLVHLASAGTLFTILAYFCGVFTRGQNPKGRSYVRLHTPCVDSRS